MVVLTAETCWALNEYWIYNKISGIKLVSLYSTSYDYYIVTLFWIACAKLNYAARINFDIFMVLYQRMLFVFIGSKEHGFDYWAYWAGQGLGNVGFLLEFLQKRVTFLQRVHIVSGAHQTPFPIDSRGSFLWVNGRECATDYSPGSPQHFSYWCVGDGCVCLCVCLITWCPI